MLANIEIVDTLLDKMRIPLGSDFDRYRNHVYRVINLTDQFYPLKDEALQQAAIAAVFHDAGIWLDRTFDYLEPSSLRAQEYLRSQGLGDWANIVSAMIVNHHRIRRVRSNKLVEAFRRADWIDVTMGAVGFGIPHNYMHALKSFYPLHGFQARLAQLTYHQIKKHPTKPLPMMRW